MRWWLVPVGRSGPASRRAVARHEMYIIRSMRSRWTRAAAGLLLLAPVACSAVPFGRQYEYEEQLYLDVDGSATVTVAASFPALVALRGLPLDPSPGGRTDRDEVRRALDAVGCGVDTVNRGWRRRGRRFIQFQISTDDVSTLSSCGALSWSSYSLNATEGVLHYVQRVGAPTPGDPGAVNWDGSELVAFKLHLPSRIYDHNVRRLEDNEPGDIDRGNILTWEQRLADRRTGAPVTMDVKMDPTSILFTTLWLFAGAFTAAVIALGSIVWWVKRRGTTIAGNG
jgi:hypothetical protein